MMSNTADVLTDEEALSHLVAWLRTRIAQRPNGDGRSLEPYGFDVYRDLLREKLRLEPIDPTDPLIVKEKLPFLNAIWNLCLRGILRPGAQTYQRGNSVATGTDFALTTYGIQWIQQTSNDALPMEYSRFSELLEAV